MPALLDRTAIKAVGIAVSVPTRGLVRAEWAVQLAQLAYPTNTTRLVNLVPGSTVAEARNACVDEALKHNARYVFFLDDDVLVPPDALLRMVGKLEQESQWALVSGIVPTKTSPTEPCVYRGNGTGGYWRWKHGDTFEIDSCGLACCLIRGDALRELEPPWFDWQHSAGNGTYMEEGEDIGFCNRLRLSGGRLLADGGVICAHVEEDGTAYTIPLDSAPFQG